MAINTNDAKIGERSVRLPPVGQVRLAEVPLGKEFFENGCSFQTNLNPSAYAKVEVGGRFRFGDQWYYRNAEGKVLKLNPNMPFGIPYKIPGQAGRFFDGVERVAILELVDRGPVRE